MIPCYSLFLEVEVPDPDLNYFIIGQHELDNTEKLLAPPPFGGGITTQAVLPPEEEAFKFWDDENFYLAIEKQGEDCWVARDDYGSHYFYAIGSHFYNRRAVAGSITFEQSWALSGDLTRTFDGVGDGDGYPLWTQWDSNTASGSQQVLMTVAWDDGVSESKILFVDCPTSGNEADYCNQPEQPDALGQAPEPPDPPDPPDPEACEPSGLNTFVLGVSCLDGTIDLLEGWGASRPDYVWVDVITDTTDITIDRGFDMKQGIVGTPIAGVMEANILDPYLDGLETSKVAVGQRVRLRAGREIVFSGVANSVRSEYDAVNTPVLKIEAVDALGLLNAQMVPVRPEEGYNTRMSEAASKVDVPIIQEDSTTILNPTEDPMSALDLLVETQDSEGSVVWLDRYGTLYSTNRYWLSLVEDLPVLKNSRFNHAPEYTFTNNPGNENEEIGIGGVTQDVCLSQYKQVADTSQVINGITFYNYIEVDDVDFEGLPIKTIVRDTHTFESANSRRLYGDASVRLTTYLPETDLVGYADYIFANYDTPRTKVETIQFPMDKWDSIDVPGMVSLDIGDPVKVRIDDPLSNHTLNRATQRIAQIRHRITPVEWLCELDLL